MTTRSRLRHIDKNTERTAEAAERISPNTEPKPVAKHYLALGVLVAVLALAVHHPLSLWVTAPLVIVGFIWTQRNL